MSEELHKLEAQRRANRDAAAALGLHPYGSSDDGIITNAAAREKHRADADSEHKARGKEPGFEDPRAEVRIAGRVLLLRDNGKLIWLQLRDATGDLQVAVSQRDCAAGFALAKLTDLGDLIIVGGRVMKTNTGEVTVWADKVLPGAKSLTPPPAKHDGLQDVEIRYRQRYLDMWANPETLSVFEQRSKIVARVRRVMEGRGYVEVETPMLQTLAGGAAARPFVTHMNALDIKLFLRIAPELYLKRLLVGGMRKVFEINRNFRNEGLDKQHNPEFTMLEAYQAYGDVRTVMELTESLVRDVARLQWEGYEANALRRPHLDGGEHAGRSLGFVFDHDPQYFQHILDNQTRYAKTLPSEVLAALRTYSNGGANPDQMKRMSPLSDQDIVLPFGELKINYSKPFGRRCYADLFADAWNFDMDDRSRVKSTLKQLRPQALHSAIDAMDHFLAVNELFEDKQQGGEAWLSQYHPAVPTFITDYPAAISPLTRPKRDNPVLADRADLFIAGMEIAPHYTELNDPDVQEAKFREQLKGLDDGKSAEEQTFRTFDHDFIRALKVGMPPAGGMGLGIDRLVMLLTDKRTIRDVVLFPMMRPE